MRKWTAFDLVLLTMALGLIITASSAPLWRWSNEALEFAMVFVLYVWLGMVVGGPRRNPWEPHPRSNE
jgi:hypothetical protein